MQDMKGAINHLKTHMTKWPATKAELVAACNDLSDFTPADKAEFESKLPEGTYKTPEEVMMAMGWQPS